MFKIEIEGSTVDQEHLNEVIAATYRSAQEIAKHASVHAALMTGTDHNGSDVNEQLLGDALQPLPETPQEDQPTVVTEPAGDTEQPEQGGHQHGH